MESLDYIFFSK